MLNPLFRLIGRFGERELFVVAGLFTVVGSAAVMHALHLSTALGAFVAGVVLAESPYRHELESDVEPFRSILLGLFFLSVGMLLDLGLIASNPLQVVALALGVIVIKAVLIGGLARGFGNQLASECAARAAPEPGRRVRLRPVRAGDRRTLILPEAASLFGAVVTLSMASTPFLMRLTDWLERREERSAEGLDGPEKSPETSAIVVGYGRFGQTVAQMLMAKGIGVTLIDKKPSMIETAGEFGTKVYYGDGLRLDLLRVAGAETAKVIAFCNDNEGGEMTRERAQGRTRGFPPGRGDGPGVRPGASDEARRARPFFRSARTVRERRDHGPRGVEGKRDRSRGSRPGRARISDARLRPARAAERDRRPARRPGNELQRGPPSGRGCATGILASRATRRSSARTMSSTTSLCAPSPLFTWIWASA